MNSAIPPALTPTLLASVAPHQDQAKAAQQAAILRAIAPDGQTILASYGIDTPLRTAHFLAQLAHESDGFCTTQEYASGEAYEGREDLGNTKPGDGVRFKGRGLIQLTGRRNYREIGARLGLDLENNPESAAEPLTSLRIACEYWLSRDINAAADADDLEAVTRLVNGGLRGFDHRRACLARARAALGC
ncbi:glycoside hydrolase family 19 protein [Algicella marina]|uniref:Glycoside hydrolase family 19 protein n=1 Tax=Algicella marina TaxID=2683284 RepID=A0A6P1T1H4_9RHOB|nr:glycoside hydrolase family 19 protein [Algicella marina]QHQ35615.1 glycoside hydrolase family 19 protein [Algicella marina]